MHFLYVAVDLGLDASGNVKPAGMAQFGRCTARALASFPSIRHLTVWSLVDEIGSEEHIQQMLEFYAHPNLSLQVKTFAGSKRMMGQNLISSILGSKYQYVMYQMINQAVLANLPFHPPYSVWEVGIEVFEQLPWIKRNALLKAQQVLSISRSTDEKARQSNVQLPYADVVHLCVEPPLSSSLTQNDPVLDIAYEPAERRPIVFILSNLNLVHLYKGHQELILGWQEVLNIVPKAELWIGGGRGDGKAFLEALVASQAEYVRAQIRFLGHLDDQEVDRCLRECRLFAMPSRGEGFGLVFVEAARYGLPSIGGKYDSVKEIISHNETGLLVEQNPQNVAQACISLLQNDELAKRLGDAARQRYIDYFQFKHFRDRLETTLRLPHLLVLEG